jgi:Fe-S cluster assembly protein SufD
MTTSSPPSTLAPENYNGDKIVPVQSRSEFFSSEDHAAFAEVTGREAQWKLSPVAKLRALMDGGLDGSRYPLESSTTEGFVVSWDTVENTPRGIAGVPEERLTANVWGQTKEVLTLQVEGVHSDPLRCVREGLGDTPRASHTVIRTMPGARATLVMVSRGSAHLGETVEFELGEGSHLQVVFVGQWSPGAINYATHFAKVGASAVFTHIVVNFGGDITVLNPTAHLVGERSEAHLHGAYFADATQHMEHRVYVDHVGPSTVSRVLYKGALHGRGARTVWVGDVLIGPDAVGTDSYEHNRNLVLSEGTRADSIPNLEIKTGDIKGAGHASATGRLDDEQLFYLQSRGIEELEARRLVVLGFLIEIVQKIDDPELVTELIAAVQAKLTQTEDVQ